MNALLRSKLVAAGIAFLALSQSARADDAASFRAGAATSNITPPLGSDIVGGFLPIHSTHIHDQLHARCLVLDDGKIRLALVVCDLLGIHRLVSDEARKRIADAVGIPRENVLISATHTHSAASAMGSDRFKYDQQPDEYQRFVARRIADGVQCAANNLRPAELAFVKVDAPEHVFNRRWSMTPGSIPPNPFGGSDLVKMNPPPGSPNLLEPAGPTDPTVSIIAVRGLDGKPISVFAAYSLHYVGGVGPGHISADYFAVFCDELARLLDAERLDPPFVAMLANGTSGDINNINFRQPRPPQKPYQQMRAVAGDVARKVQAGLAGAVFSREIALAARYREPAIGWRKPSEEQLAWAKNTLSAKSSAPGKADLPAIYAERTLRMADYPDVMPMPLQVLRIGQVCIGSMPNEVFCEIGLEFKRRSPFRDAFMVSLNHGYYGYLPTPRQHDLGGYETWLGTNRLEKHASEKMLHELLEMASDLKKETP
ncbi:MAG TPA: neutral/alkaline non-lysosomal ceramidase N-terminal domain-containing protein [Pirellulales bacterium]|nr:neutral/alkaline non-lysosomal ceramidase N-terminal domain-containing protein [Pirellulales bacterium]